MRAITLPCQNVTLIPSVTSLLPLKGSESHSWGLLNVSATALVCHRPEKIKNKKINRTDCLSPTDREPSCGSHNVSTGTSYYSCVSQITIGEYVSEQNTQLGLRSNACAKGDMAQGASTAQLRQSATYKSNGWVRSEVSSFHRRLA